MLQARRFEGWAIVELMGHTQLAGYVQEAMLAGSTVLRVDVPATDHAEQSTRYVSPQALYCVTPTTEEVARAVAQSGQSHEPVYPWVLRPAPEIGLLPHPEVEFPDGEGGE